MIHFRHDDVMLLLPAGEKGRREGKQIKAGVIYKMGGGPFCFCEKHFVDLADFLSESGQIEIQIAHDTHTNGVQFSDNNFWVAVCFSRKIMY